MPVLGVGAHKVPEEKKGEREREREREKEREKREKREREREREFVLATPGLAVWVV